MSNYSRSLKLSIQAFAFISIILYVAYRVINAIQYRILEYPQLFVSFFIGIIPIAILVVGSLIKDQFKKWILLIVLACNLLLTTIFSVSSANYFIQNIDNFIGWMNYLPSILVAVIELLILIDVINKFKFIRLTKALALINILINTITLIIAVVLATYMYYVDPVALLLDGLSSIAANITVLLLIYYIAPRSQKVMLEDVEDIETELLKLKQQFDCGCISEDEYMRRKAVAINKL